MFLQRKSAIIYKMSVHIKTIHLNSVCSILKRNIITSFSTRGDSNVRYHKTFLSEINCSVFKIWLVSINIKIYFPKDCSTSLCGDCCIIRITVSISSYKPRVRSHTSEQTTYHLAYYRIRLR